MIWSLTEASADLMGSSGARVTLQRIQIVTRKLGL